MMTSVVIPCRNGEAVLPRQLEALARQSVSDFQIVVSDNGSTDATRAVAESFRDVAEVDVTVVDASDRVGINHARNVGVRASSGEYVLMCDADDEVGPEWVAAMTQALQQGAACVGGVVERVDASGSVVGVDKGIYEMYWPGVPWPIGANCGFRRSVFDELEGFDEEFRGGGDEAEFFYRAALRGYATEAVSAGRVRYSLRSDFSDVWRQHVGYGRGAADLYLKFRASGMPRDAVWRAVGAIAWHGTMVLFCPRRRRRGLEALAQRLGRLAQSGRNRVLYL